MGLSREERRALRELERRLVREEPELDAMLSGALDSETEPLPTLTGNRSLLQVWCMLVMLTCAVLMIGIVLLISGERSCTGLQSSSCQRPASTQEG
ncbi:DUF3040 domain-containing protein [Nonomuraea rubra]|uniref:DUF3040 domain-containing protein n=1 Tax=Nonomuraea rubra TaxID=46180 RepID=A0A7X0TZH8_9ACTN|nr:DUF3040 domain-containing protein [Nonomuraea rubra]MBB6549692.1 hypothetical protein [Nonomuraea rubra]